MSNPIILSEEIVSLAKMWRDKCFDQLKVAWSESHRNFIGEAALVSPVDGGERKVALYISQNFSESGALALTCPPGVIDNCGRPVAKDGYYCILMHRSLAFDRKQFLPVLLHELVHVVDPEFLADCERKKTWRGTDPKTHACRQYALQSELLAFSGMWIEELRNRLDRGTLDTKSFASEMCSACKAFAGFYTFGPSVVPDLTEQIEDHFKQIVARVTAQKTIGIGAVKPGS